MIANAAFPHTQAIDFDPFVGPEIVRVAPSTEPQMEVWTACMVGGDDATRAYNLSVSLRLQGALHRFAMEQAIQALVGRHDALHSAFSADGEHICILENLLIDIVYQDISEQTADEKERLLAVYLKQDALHVFSLLHGPLFKVGLFKLSDQEHRLVLTTHHIVCDGWSMGVILQDLSAFYSAYVQGITLSLHNAPSLAQYAQEQLQFCKTDEYRQIEDFWVNKYKGNVPSFDLPIDFPRPDFRTYKSNRLDYQLDDELVQAVKKMGLKAGCSFVTTLLAAFEVLIHRSSGHEDIVIGLPTAGQSVTGNNQLVGHCVNLLPLRSHLKTDVSFLNFLKICRQSVFDAHEHQRLTFSSLFRKLNIPRDASRVPLVPVIFNVDMGMNDGVSFHNLTHQLMSHPKEYENFEWFFNITESDKSLIAEWSYNTHLFKAETIDRMMAEFKNILKTVVANPSVIINDIKFKSEDKLSEKLTHWNDTNAQYPYHTPLHALISQTAFKYPAKTALIFNGQSISYQKLNETANQIAHYLIQKGIKTGDIVGIALDRSPEMLMTLLAILKTGAAYLPLDPEYPQNRLTFMLTDSSASLLITSKKYQGRLNSQATEILIENALTESAVHTTSEPDSSVSGDDLAYVLYTSGSTGKPKGVLIEHHNLVNFLWSMQAVPGIDKDDIFLAVTTISFDIAGLELYLPLITGATVLMADATAARDGRALLNLIRAEKVSVMQATPATWRMMLDSGWDKSLPLKVLCGGEALPKDLADNLISKCSLLWNVYGPTETTIWSTVKQISNSELITIGRPINNTQVYILDEFLKPVTEGIVGEIYIAGDGVARGYLNRQELTNEKFIKNPFDTRQKNRMYRTGDLGKFLENGEIQCLGRVDQQVKVRGHRIELGEIEHALSTIQDIKEAVVIAREDQPGDQRLVAYVVPNSITEHGRIPYWQDGLKVPQEQVQVWRQYLQGQLPNYMVPNDFIALTKLPLTPNGKIDKKALPKPTLDGTESQRVYTAPRTDVERLVTAVWMECLRLDEISVYDDFFDLGGHSLIAIQIMNRLEKKVGKRLPLSTLFEYPTVEKLSLALETDSESITWDSLVPMKPNGTKMPLYIVHGEGLHVMKFNSLVKHMDVDQPVYGLQAKGINGVGEPLQSMEDIAAYYIDAIMKQNSDGPYALAGYSFGGIIAYEMSKQLIEKGKKVKLLALFDTHADRSDYFDPWLSRVWNTFHFAVKRYLYTFVLFKKDLYGTISYKKESVKRRLHRLYSKIRYRKNHYKMLYGDNYKVYQSNDIAYRNYKLVPQEITIDLFRAEERMYYLEDYEYLGWKPFALKGVNIHKIPGDHVSLFSAPNDKEFARVLQKALNNC